MANFSLTIPSRTYPLGVTTGSRNLPNSQSYRTITLTADLTGWTSALTTRVSIAVAWSHDNGSTFQPFLSIDATTPPPFPHKNGSNNILTATAARASFAPTHMQGSLTVEGQAVTLGDITFTAS